jgi:hypothetical protein
MSLQVAPFTQDSLTKNPRLRDALHLLDEGRIDTAINELRAQSAQSLAGAAFLLGAVYFQEQRYEELVAHLAHCAELEHDSSAWMLSGAAQHKLGRFRDAYLASKRALRLDWRNMQAHRFAWTALYDLGLGAPAWKIAQAAILRDHGEPPSMDESARPPLDDVTLCAVDCVTPALAVRALRISASLCRFGRVLLLTSTGHRADGIETRAIAHLGSGEAYSAFVLRELVTHVNTGFVLLIQWDGYVLSPTAWRREFLDYDYIGARWLAANLGADDAARGHDVGNGGFSLRSRRFLEAAAALARPLPESHLHPEDVIACRQWRPELEARANVRFAPDAVADRFSMEHALGAEPTFGFHGALNLAHAINDPAFSRLDFLEGQLGIE